MSLKTSIAINELAEKLGSARDARKEKSLLLKHHAARHSARCVKVSPNTPHSPSPREVSSLTAQVF